MRKLTVLITAVLLVAAGCSRSDEANPTTTTATTTPATTMTTTTTLPQEGEVVVNRQPRPLPAFADFEAIPLLGDSPVYAGPATPSTLDGIVNPNWLPIDGPARDALADHGFVVVPGWVKQFQYLYGSALYEGQTFFITTDAAYHVLHLAFSKLLRDTEQDALLPVLDELVTGLADAGRAQAAELAGTDLEEPASRVARLFEAAAVLLGLDVGAVGPLAGAEVDLARQHTRLTASPITSYSPCVPTVSPANCVDYSLFTPRGHYTRNEELTRYFLGMSLLGQASFFVTDSDSLRLGILAARVLTSDPALVELWTTIYEPTAFLVGIADDYTPFELAAVVDDAVSGWVTDPAPLADPAVVRAIGDDLLASRDVGINPEAAAVRIMGARFVIDSYVLDQLGWPNVGTEEKRRVKVSPLDLAAAFGSQLAYDLQEASGQREFLNYDEQLTAMTDLLATRPISAWASTVYDAWLYALEPVLVAHGGAFPDFMQTPEWTAKSLQTGLASYAELKHDTILYAKQGIAAEGGDGGPAVPPRHWVEPDPVAFRRMAAVVDLLEAGLDERGLLGTGERRTLLADVGTLLERLARLAADELAGKPITDEDNRWLESIGSTLEALWLATADLDPDTLQPSADDTDAALIADIFRSTFEVLEIGTGRIDQLYVLVPNDTGDFQVAVGGVYSYYEFWNPADQRLTDQEWQAMLDEGTQPARPAWQDVFLVR